MEIIPAIDILGGRCVRLYQGDYARETVFSEDPVAMARRWEAEGAPRLHLIDLDGARAGEPVNAEVIERVVCGVNIPCQVGGGIRSLDTVLRYLEMGVQRIILGTAAVRAQTLVAEACYRYPGSIIVGVDARGGQAAISGWLERSEEKAEALMARLVELGVPRFIYTDIARDGTLKGPNFAALDRRRSGRARPRHRLRRHRHPRPPAPPDAHESRRGHPRRRPLPRRTDPPGGPPGRRRRLAKGARAVSLLTLVACSSLCLCHTPS